MQDQILDSHDTQDASPLARTLLLIAIGLAPLFILPINGFPFALTKMSVFVILLSIATIALGLSSLRHGHIKLPSSKVFLMLAALVGAYGIATVLSQDWKLSLIGTGAETDTFAFIAAAAFTSVLVALLFASKSAANRLLKVIAASAGLAAVFQLVRIYVPSMFEDSVFASATTNLVGGWNDFGILMAALVVLCVSYIDGHVMRAGAKIAAVAGLVVGVFLCAVVNFTMLWWALIAACVCVALGYMLAERGEGMGTRIPFASVAVIAVSIVFLVWGPQLSTRVQKIAPAQQIEAQLTLPTSIEVTRATYAQSALTTFFGSGPATFAQQWLLYKPASLTNSDFWTLDFAAGFSTIATAFLTAGLLGGIIFLVIPVLVLIAYFRSVRHVLDPQEKQILVSAGGLSALLWAMIALYAPGQVVLLLAFAALGLVGAYAVHRKEHHLQLFGHTLGQIVLVAVVLVVIAGACAITQRFLGNVYQGRALVAASEGNMALAQANARRALSVHRSEEALHLLATLKFTEAQTIAGESDKATESTRANRLQAALSDANVYATAAAQTYPTHWGNWLTLAQLYEALIPLKVEGAYQQSQIAYANAIRLSPRNPELYLMVARMEAAAGNEQNARSAVAQALTLKQNYTDAILFIVQLEVAKNNIDGALNAAAAAVQTSPNNAGLWFQLGVLAYQKGDDKNAAAALKQAIVLVPDYANAKFFLGLALYRAGSLGDAVAIFDELAKQNPENTQVASILADMKSGKPAPAPTTAPVKEN